jgi:hypothetical protein
VVNQVNEFQMSRQKSVQEFNTPFFKGFGQNSVISV